MRCPNCSHENRPTAQFCENCGGRLEKKCSKCGTSNRLAAKFCDSCGNLLAETGTPETSSPIPAKLAQKLETARLTRAMLGERRVVTMLFCDVVGSTAAAEKLDPEEWREIINGAFEHMIAPVYRYEGTLARLMGDAILAFFGAPIAHEDDPQRAILAGLEIVSGITPYWQRICAEWDIEANVRVGINTGLVVVGAVGSDLKMEYTALGDAINVASRMEQTAEAGTVQVSVHTYRLAEPLFEWQPLGEQTVKGKSQPIKVYRPLRKIDAPLGQRGVAGLDAPLVGRAEELHSITTAIDSLKSGRGGLVFLIGEAGLGKSRLIREARAAWEDGDPARGKAPYWIERRASSYDSMQAYSMARGMLRVIAGLEETAQPADIRAGIDAWARSLDLPPDKQETLQQVVSRLFSPDPGDGPEQDGFKDILIDALFEFMLARYRDTPGVMVIDDLHWADAASTELLARLIPVVEQAPILFIIASRPEWDTPGWEVKTRAQRQYPHRCREILLTPLEENEGWRLINELLAQSDLPDSLLDLIQSRAEGNPFFVEEILREFIEEGVLVREESVWQVNENFETIKVPDSIEALLTARIDRLTPAARQVLQVAAVIGRTFYYRLVAEVSRLEGAVGASLAELERVQMIEESARRPELEYMFRHALTQETAYRSILKSQRRDFHLQVGQAIESEFPDRLAEFAPVLAFHFEEAGAWDRAAQHHTAAGEAAFRLFAGVEAVRHFDRAIDLVKRTTSGSSHDSNARMKHLFLRKGRALELASRFPEAVENYREMEAWGQANNDIAIVLAGVMGQAVLHCTPTHLFSYEIGGPLVERALKLAKELGDPETEARGLWAKMIMYRLLIRGHEAVEIGQYGLEIAEKHNLKEQKAYLLHDLGYVYAEVGDSPRSAASFKESGILWQELGNLPLYADGLVGNIINRTMQGEFDQALEDSRRGLEIAERTRNIWGQSFSRMYLGSIYRELGEYSKGIQGALTSIEDGKKAGFYFPEPFCSLQLTQSYCDLGDLGRAETTARRSFEAVGGSEGQDVRLLGTMALVIVMVHRRELEKARPIIENLLGSPDYIDNLLFLYSGHPEFSYLDAAGEPARGLETCERKLTFSRAGGIPAHLAETLLWKARFLLRLDRPQEALPALEEARGIAESLKQRRVLWQIHSELAALRRALGQHQEAENDRLQAARLVSFIAENAPDDLRPHFLSLPAVLAVTMPGQDQSDKSHS